MPKEELIKKIQELLPKSQISEYQKSMLKALMPTMEIAVLEKTLNALMFERQKMGELAEKKNRITMKYKVMIEKLSELELKK